ncbi:MAG: hypothetical protein ACLVGL_12600 [Waltera sp.]
MASMGSYIPVMLAFVCIHSIVFQYHPQQVQFLPLSGDISLLWFLSDWLDLLEWHIFFKSPYGNFDECLHSGSAGTGLQYPLYVRICRQPTNYNNPTDRQHFYAYSLEQIKREENLKKIFPTICTIIFCKTCFPSKTCYVKQNSQR